MNGGADSDSVDFTAGTYDDEAALSGVLSDVEELDFTGTDVIADLTLSSAQIRNMTDSENKLTITANTDDTVDIDAGADHVVTDATDPQTRRST